MELKKCLNITRCENFSISIYTKGYTKEQREIEEVPIVIFDVERDEKGNICYGEFEAYSKCNVTEIIPHSDGVNIVAELNYEITNYEDELKKTAILLKLKKACGIVGITGLLVSAVIALVFFINDYELTLGLATICSISITILLLRNQIDYFVKDELSYPQALSLITACFFGLISFVGLVSYFAEFMLFIRNIIK